MNIVLVTATYPPEIRAISAMMAELAQGLRDKGHSVTVLTCYPRFNLDPGRKAGKLAQVTDEGGITVVRVSTLPLYRWSYIVRGLSQLLMPFSFLSSLRALGVKADAVIVYSPPLPLAIVGRWLKKRHQAFFLLNVQDIFPQNAVDLGILKNRLLVRFFERMASEAYAEADKITSHTDSSAVFLRQKAGVPGEKLSVVHNWIDTSAYDSAPHLDFKERFGLKGKFVFLFAGVLGPSQDIDFCLELAARVGDERISFLFVGDGSEKKRLMEKSGRMGLANVLFKDYVSPAEYPSLVREMDAGLLCLSRLNRTPVVPGKLLGFMAAGKPVAAFLNAESDAHALIAQSGCGYSCISHDTEKALSIVIKLYEDAQSSSAIGANGRVFVKGHFSLETCLEKIEKLLEAR